MEKNHFLFKKLLSVFMIFLILNILIYISTTTTTKANVFNDIENIKYSELLYENQMLKNKYETLEERLIKIEKQLISIDKYDKIIYSKILGLNVDSSDLNAYYKKFNNDSIHFDSMFKMLDNKTLLMSKIVSDQLNNLIKNNEIICNNSNILNLYPNITPIRTIDIIEISSGFGWRTHPVYNTPIFHDGVDIAVNKNTKVFSTLNGKVVEVKYSKYGYGNKIVIKNSADFEVLYAHLSEKIYVKKGQIVTKGQLIATSGNSGTSTGPHLHYEIRKNDKLIDPLGYFYTHLTNKLITNN
jgi:hypothetical protein